MKTYSQLTETEKQKAYDKVHLEYLTALTEMGPSFFFAEELVKRAEKAFSKAQKMLVPWFAHEYLIEDPAIATELDEMVLDSINNALYAEPNERVIDGVAR